jgi:short-subunit dehydrogenase
MAREKFALVTGASTGIGLELARLAAQDGYDLLVTADTPLADAIAQLRALGAQVTALEADLATLDGVDELLAAAAGRPIDVLFANAGHGLGGPFLEQELAEWRHVIDTNTTGTIYLVQQVARAMVERGSGRILITGSIAGHIAGAFQAVYNASKAFIDSFADALGNELKDTPVTVTCLKPGPTETEFFDRAGLEDTKVGTAKKDDPAAVARTGYDAMLAGKRSAVHGLANKLQVAGAKVLGGGVSAEMHRKQAEPGSGKD